jgi:hypothetical protein
MPVLRLLACLAAAGAAAALDTRFNYTGAVPLGLGRSHWAALGHVSDCKARLYSSEIR